MSAAFCGDATCSARIQVWLVDPADEIIRDPCRYCLDTLVAMFAVLPDGPPTLAALYPLIENRL